MILVHLNHGAVALDKSEGSVKDIVVLGGWPTLRGFAKAGTNAACTPIFHP